MKPTKEELLLHVDDRKKAAEYYDVCEKTIINWMKSYGLYQPKENFGCNKLNMVKAQEIRDKYKQGNSIDFLSKEYGVTHSTIGRIVNNVTYRQIKEFADVSVIYNSARSLR